MLSPRAASPVSFVRVLPAVRPELTIRGKFVAGSGLQPVISICPLKSKVLRTLENPSEWLERVQRWKVPSSALPSPVALPAGP